MGTTTLATLQTRLSQKIGDEDQIHGAYYELAINDAIRETYPDVHKPLDDTSLITGNILPPFNWTSSSALDIYTSPSGTLAKTTTAGYYRHASGSAKVTASGADDAIVLDSNAFPRLLDIMDKSVSLKCWAIPEDADDAFLDIITTDSDGNDTTKSSTTSCTAGVFTLLEIEDYDVPDDIVRVRIKLRVHTDTKYAYFDPPRLTGKTNYEYLLPYDFQEGTVEEVHIQSSSYSDDACDDLHPRYGNAVIGHDIIQDGTRKYIFIPYSSSKRRVRLIGHCPLEALSSSTDTISLDDKLVDLLITYAAFRIFERQIGTAASTEVSRYQSRANYWYGKYQGLLRTHAMPRKSQTLKIGY